MMNLGKPTQAHHRHRQRRNRKTMRRCSETLKDLNDQYPPGGGGIRG